MTASTLSIVVMAYNEADNVGPVLGELCDWLQAHEPEAQIVFVDDGSSDATSACAADALRDVPHVLVRHETNRGMGAALKSGVRKCRGEWVTFLPADGQLAPSTVGVLREGARARDADVVLSVYAHRDDGLRRKFLSWGVRTLILVVHGVRMQSDGPYLFRRSLFVPEQLPPDTFFLNFEFPIRVLAAGLRVATVEVECRPRRSGKSKTSGTSRVFRVAGDLFALRWRRAQEALRRATDL